MPNVGGGGGGGGGGAGCAVGAPLSPNGDGVCGGVATVQLEFVLGESSLSENSELVEFVESFRTLNNELRLPNDDGSVAVSPSGGATRL